MVRKEASLTKDVGLKVKTYVLSFGGKGLYMMSCLTGPHPHNLYWQYLLLCKLDIWWNVKGMIHRKMDFFCM